MTLVACLILILFAILNLLIGNENGSNTYNAAAFVVAVIGTKFGWD